MAISKMAKVMIVSHRSEVSELLESLQRDGICQILNAEEAMVSKDFPDLNIAADRPKETEELAGRLTKTIAFLKDYAQLPKGFAAALRPRSVIDEQMYKDVVSDDSLLEIVERCEQCQASIEKLKTEAENLNGILDQLAPWRPLPTPVEQLAQLQQATCLTGLLPAQKLEQIKDQLSEFSAVIEQVSQTGSTVACLVVCHNDDLTDVQKLLRAADFDAVNFQSLHLTADEKYDTHQQVTGTVAELIEKYTEQLSRTTADLQAEYERAASLAENILQMQILCDHYSNLFDREQTKSTAPATEQTVILEGWVKEKEQKKLGKIVSQFNASSLSTIEPAEGEEIPIEIENNNIVKPFEVITRLYGMPQHFEVDPTVFLAPFFALFFALCLTDAGYGIIMMLAFGWFVRKMQGDKKMIMMLVICSALTIGAGAMTGGWFGDSIQLLNIGWLNAAREKMMWFDPIEKPMTFFYLSLALGYVQILTGLLIAFVHNLKRGQYVAGICDQLTWLVMLNCFAAYGFSRSELFVTAEAGAICLKAAIVPAITILLFSHREGNIIAKLGMGFYNLASAMFYIGDILSYVRLMALGMVTAGFAMAINQMAIMASGVKFIGPILAVVVLLGGHTFNLAISALGSFVHSLRLQYVEFFPKFFEGGGRLFEPFVKEHKYVYIESVEAGK